MAVAMPQDQHWPEHPKERAVVLAVLSRVTELTLGPLGVWRLVPELRETPPYGLLPGTWTAYPHGERLWASVTPVAFDTHPKEKERGRHVEAVTAMVREACTRVGVPEPVDVRVTPVSAHLGAPTSRDYPRLRRNDGSMRRHTHVVLEFPRPVVGPVLLGAGRYRGYGLCRPLGNIQ
jgi:CRISPR-associated protein Csb2